MTRLPPTDYRPPRGPRPRVYCPWCSGQVPLTPRGHLRAHGPGEIAGRPEVTYAGRQYCAGSWRDPDHGPSLDELRGA